VVVGIAEAVARRPQRRMGRVTQGLDELRTRRAARGNGQASGCVVWRVTRRRRRHLRVERLRSVVLDRLAGNLRFGDGLRAVWRTV
jgi:hypothetical protein